MNSNADPPAQLQKTDRRPTVSVIIIFFNAECFMEEAIESVFAQTYPEWELLLVDDGSRDQSTAIARRYAGRQPERVRYFEHAEHQNCGMSASRNLGIQQARGKYIAFLDADDVWLPHKLERQVAILDSRPEASMVYGLSQWWYSWTGRTEDRVRDFVHELGVAPNTPITPPGLLSLFFFRQQAAIPSPSSILVRRDIVERIGGFEEGFRGLYEDQVFYAKLGLAAPVIPLDECWDRYRQHPGSSESSVHRREQAYAARLHFLNWLAAYLSDHAVLDKEIWRGLRTEQWHYRHPRLYELLVRLRSFVRTTSAQAAQMARLLLPTFAFQWLWARWHDEDYIPPTGWVRFGSFRRLTPLSRQFGFDRGLAIDRYYIERFLTTHTADVRGYVLEIGDDIYTHRFGAGRVTKSEILHLTGKESRATIVADLTRAEGLPAGVFDCVILTQTLQFIYDVHAAAATVYRLLKPGGILLATVPGISAISRYDMERWGQYWCFTTLSAKRLFEEVFSPGNVVVEGHGNVLAGACFLYGMAAQELNPKELEESDPDYEVLITVRAVK